MDDDSAHKMDIDDLVSGKAAELLGEGVFPTKAILIVETAEGEGMGLRWVKAGGVTTWQALGMVRSILLRIENDDLDAWEEFEDEEDWDE